MVVPALLAIGLGPTPAPTTAPAPTPMPAPAPAPAPTTRPAPTIYADGLTVRLVSLTKLPSALGATCDAVGDCRPGAAAGDVLVRVDVGLTSTAPIALDVVAGTAGGISLRAGAEHRCRRDRLRVMWARRTCCARTAPASCRTACRSGHRRDRQRDVRRTGRCTQRAHRHGAATGQRRHRGESAARDDVRQRPDAADLVSRSSCAIRGVAPSASFAPRDQAVTDCVRLSRLGVALAAVVVRPARGAGYDRQRALAGRAESTSRRPGRRSPATAYPELIVAARSEPTEKVPERLAEPGTPAVARNP